MPSYSKGSTIAAIATPLGEGGVAIIRVSGDRAVEYASKVYSDDLNAYPTHTLRFGKIIHPFTKEIIDEVLITVMRAPRSYTGEETVEIQCHGGNLVTQRVLEAVLEAGAQPALPGEFTFKAYINGKIDLAQAEAVQELIAAKSDMALKAAQSQLQGALSQKIKEFQQQLIEMAAFLEASIDFPEEDLGLTPFSHILLSAQTLYASLEKLVSSFDRGRVSHHGFTVCLFGGVNVGKSSLMNALLEENRVIVTDIPGTTRDLVEAEVRTGGLHFRLIDTAGIRHTEDLIEQEGIRRSRQALQESHLVLLVLDATVGVTEEDRQWLQELPQEKRVVLWNKIDLPSPHHRPPEALSISAKEKIGLHDLHHLLQHTLHKKSSQEELFLTNIRHQQILKTALEFVAWVIKGLQKGSPVEFLLSDIRSALTELGAIIRIDIEEGLLSTIFSKFCIGK